MAKNLNLGNFWTTSWPNISKLQFFSEKQVSFKFKVILGYSDFGLFWRLFREYLQIMNFFQRSASVTFLPLCKKLHAKNQKIPWSRFWENCVTNQSTNQPTNYYQQHWSYRTSLTQFQTTWRIVMLSTQWTLKQIKN